jgi:hypothetical protein
MGRSLRQLKDGSPGIGEGKVRREAHLDGKSILSTGDDTLSPEDVAPGYKQLLEVERAFRTREPLWIFLHFRTYISADVSG